MASSEAELLVRVRRARPSDAAAIAAIHVASWRSAYPGILPDTYLARLSVARQAVYYDTSIRAGAGMFVACVAAQGSPGRGVGSAPRAAASNSSSPSSSSRELSTQSGTPRVIGFCSVSAGRGEAAARRVGRPLGEGEVETLYVLDDWRDRGIGRELLRAGAMYLVNNGCCSAFLWVLRDNPSRWFYKRLGGREAALSETLVGGSRVPQIAYVWDSIGRLTHAPTEGTEPPT